MLGFVHAVCKQVAIVASPKEVEKIFALYGHVFEPTRFSEDAVVSACRHLCRSLDQSEEIEINPKKLDTSIGDFLLDLTGRISNCDVEHIKNCSSHQVVLLLVLNAYLAVLGGVNLEEIFAKLKAVITSVRAQEYVMHTKEEYCQMATGANWGLLMTNPDMLALVAYEMAQVPQAKRRLVLETLAYSVGDLESPPGKEDLKELIQMAKLGVSTLN